ncbi:MAG TPA: protein kinase [Pyrinomonadaceae bacterium]|nr:protein kinase [Pyrinomonadaceae bacterium]
MRIKAGTRLGHYEVRSKIGEGGMGEVYQAVDTELDRTVALKILPEDVSSDKQRMLRFIQEAKSASALNHPHILTIYEIGSSPTVFEGSSTIDAIRFIAMEFIDGETLRHRMREGRLKLTEILEIASQAARAIAAAHAAGIIHRDIKPENIMVRRDGYIKVLDFGLAKLTEPERSITDTEAPTRALVNTVAGTVIGTVNYMSPEQAKGKSVDARTDLWSLGAVIYEMMTGHVPFEAETPSEVIALILKQEPSPMARYERQVPHELERIVTKALTKDGEERYQTAKDFLVDLKRLKRQLDLEAEIQRTLPPEFRTSGGITEYSGGHAPATSKLSRSVWTTGTASAERTHQVSSAEYIVSEIKRHKKGFGITAAIAIGLVLASTFYFIYARRATALTDKDTILLADFVNTTGDPVFDDTLKQALAVQLGQSPFLNIFGDDRVRDALRFTGRSPDERVTRELGREICQRQGLKALLTGSISGLGTHYIITLEAINAQTGDAIAREQAEAEGKELVVKKLGEAATKLREKLGESLASIKNFDTPLEQATTSSLEALKAFSLGREQARKANNLESIPFYKRAIELDPNFASAYSGLEIAYFNTEQLDLAAQAAEKAFALRDRVSEHEKFLISSNYYWDVTGELDKVIETYKLWARTYPRDDEPPNSLSVLYSELGQYEKAIEEAQEALRRGSSGSAVPYSNLARAFRGRNRLEEAKATIQQGMAQKFDTAGYHNALYIVGFIESDEATMQQQVEWARGKPSEAGMLVQQAGTAAYLGQLRKAREFYDRATELSRDSTENVAQTMLSKLRTEAIFGNCQHVKEKVSAALAIARVKTTLPVAAITLAQCGEAVQAQSLIEELTKQFPKDTRLNAVSQPMARAFIEINRNNPSQAIQLLQPASQYELGFIAGLEPAYIRGLAYLRQQSGTQAMAEFQKIIDHRYIVANSPLYPFAFVGLARAAVIAGDTVKARKAYQDFLALWNEADSDIPILSEAKKEYEKLK